MPDHDADSWADLTAFLLSGGYRVFPEAHCAVRFKMLKAPRHLPLSHYDHWWGTDKPIPMVPRYSVA